MPIVSGGGGGGTPYTAPITRQQLVGNAVAIASAASGVITWDSQFGPNALLDRADLSLPVVVTAGVYVVSVDVQGVTMTVNGNFNAALHLDFANEDAQVAATSSVSQAANTTPHALLTLCYYIPAGGSIKLLVTNLDGVASRNFSLSNAIVQRIS